MPRLSKTQRRASHVATACVLLAGCGSGDLQPIRIGDGGVDAEEEEHHSGHGSLDAAAEDVAPIPRIVPSDVPADGCARERAAR
jgi:hypothetical protein